VNVVTTALVVLALGTSLAAAAPQVPSGEPPGRERYRFVDPPGAGLQLPREPSTTLPYETRRPAPDCAKPGRKKRKRCAPAR
jgi:hypothetical protein